MDQKEINELFLLLSIVLPFALRWYSLYLFILFQKRKNALLLNQKESEKRFEKEITTSKIEIREETFRNISWELHDNIGQLITLAKLQIQNDDEKELVGQTLSKALNELRILSRHINPEAFAAITFTQALQQEIDRFNRLNYLKASMRLIGYETVLDSKVETVLFRILQEFFTNTIKHAKATTLELRLIYKRKYLCVQAIDNGIGFDVNERDSVGIGLNTIKKRSQLIGAEARMESNVSKGTKLAIIYYYSNEKL